jgi:DNA recombination-dependent growth factor C
MEAIPDSLWASIPERLRQCAFQEIEETAEERGWGWVCFDDMLDSHWHSAPPEKGAYLTFSLRLDTRRIPPAVMNKHLTLALREEERKIKEQGKKYVSRERKKELKEQIQLKLRARSLPIPAYFNVVWNMQTREVFFTSTQEKMIDLFTDYFTHTFGLTLEKYTPYSLAASLFGEGCLETLDAVEPTDFANYTGA